MPVITNPTNTGVFAGETAITVDGDRVNSSVPLPTIIQPGSAALAESWFAGVATQKTLSNGVNPEDGVSAVSIPSGARVAYIHVQGDRLYWRVGGTTLNIARCAYTDPGRILTIDTSLGAVLLKGSASTNLYVVFM
jgi:hypothetical protein